jgi:hypothetical protein
MADWEVLEEGEKGRGHASIDGRRKKGVGN